MTPRVVAVTGTRHGASGAQLQALRRLLAKLAPDVLLHGSCQGADTQAALLALALSRRPYVVAHPGPQNPWDNPGAPADETKPRKPFLTRNRDMVDALGPGDALVALPREYSPQVRGGTWGTVRYARKTNKVVWVISPGGTTYHYPRPGEQQQGEEES